MSPCQHRAAHNMDATTAGSLTVRAWSLVAVAARRPQGRTVRKDGQERARGLAAQQTHRLADLCAHARDMRPPARPAGRATSSGGERTKGAPVSCPCCGALQESAQEVARQRDAAQAAAAEAGQLRSALGAAARRQRVRAPAAATTGRLGLSLTTSECMLSLNVWPHSKGWRRGGSRVSHCIAVHCMQ